MNLILASSNEIVAGKPLPWTLYDRDRNVLLRRGDVVLDNAHRDTLLASGACYEFSGDAPGNTDGESNLFAAEEASSKQSWSKEAEKKNYTFDDMKLKVGDRLNIEIPAEYDFRFSAQRQAPNERCLVKVIGFLKGASLLVTAPNTVNVQLIGGKKVVMRSFTGQNAFGFSCNIERICKVPYAYLHLSFPDVIQGIVIRKAPRVKTRIIATVQGSKSDAEEQISALISDISASGVSLDARQPLGEKGDMLNLSFRMPLHNIDAYLSVKGIIRAILSNGADDATKPDDASKTGLIRHGVEFQELQPNDCLILQSMIYQQMIENPHKMM